MASLPGFTLKVLAGFKVSPDWFPNVAEDSVRVIALDFDEAILGDTIATTTWTSEPDDITFASLAEASNVTEAKISGQSGGQEYAIACKITTTTGTETAEVHARLRVIRDEEV